MKILCLCDEGNSRSVTLAHQLKYLPERHDVLTAGLNRNSPETLRALHDWADRVLLTGNGQFFPFMRAIREAGFQGAHEAEKIDKWDLGPDGPQYHRPFNPLLLARCKALVAQHRDSLRAESNGNRPEHTPTPLSTRKRPHLSPPEALEDQRMR